MRSSVYSLFFFFFCKTEIGEKTVKHGCCATLGASFLTDKLCICRTNDAEGSA